MMIEDFRKLAPLMDGYMTRLLDRLMQKARAAGSNVAEVDIGLSHGALKRAGLFFVGNVQQNEADMDDAGLAFAYAWSHGEREAMRRCMAAISSPAAKGREADVIAALMKGASIEEALARTNSEPAAPVTETARVVAFPARRVTDSADDETRASEAVSPIGPRTNRKGEKNDY
ncbi:hypothetical protein [Ciceribacter azotifigens]|uniref:hypothetical protein n=1 Tax=Ciceribacter azotifigens TaxID=2069303 RepID=UPI003A88235D